MSSKHSVRSIDKKSSRKSVKSRSAQSVSVKSIEDPLEICKNIMREILESALERIHQRYMEEQTLKFVVHCTHEALMKVLRIYFYQHNDYKRSQEFWGSDRRLEPSFADSWAAQQTPFSKRLSTQEDFTTLSEIKLEMRDKGLEVDVPELELGKALEPVTSASLIDDVRSILYNIVDRLPIVDEEMSEKAESIASAFTLLVEGTEHYSNFRMKPQMSRISVDSTFVKLPNIDAPNSDNSRRCPLSDTEFVAYDTFLPPIRTAADYKCKDPVPPEDAEKSKSKKKKR